jgi:hypothetical protein
MRQTFCRDLRFPLGFCRSVRYNEDTNDFEGGEPHDKRRGLKRLFPQDHPAVALAALLYCIFRSACVKNGELDYLWLWILCGLPFGIWRLRLWIIPGGGSLGGGIALFLLNFIFAGLIGGCVLVWRLLVAAWYVPLTLYRLLTAGCECVVTED